MRVIFKIYLRFKMYPISIIQKWKYNSLNAGNIEKTVQLLKKKSRRPTFISNCIVYGLAIYIFWRSNMWLVYRVHTWWFGILVFFSVYFIFIEKAKSIFNFLFELQKYTGNDKFQLLREQKRLSFRTIVFVKKTSL